MGFQPIESLNPLGSGEEDASLQGKHVRFLGLLCLSLNPLGSGEVDASS